MSWLTLLLWGDRDEGPDVVGVGESEVDQAAEVEGGGAVVEPAVVGGGAAAQPNTRYVGHITYLPVGGGRFLYLATVVDLYSRWLVGWSIADHMRTELVVEALRAAAHTCGGRLDGAVFHSDNGAQYCSQEFARACRRLGVTRLRSAVGTSADNAAAESFNASLKRETLRVLTTGPTPAPPAWPCSVGSPATARSGGTRVSAS